MLNEHKTKHHHMTNDSNPRIESIDVPMVIYCNIRLHDAISVNHIVWCQCRECVNSSKWFQTMLDHDLWKSLHYHLSNWKFVRWVMLWKMYPVYRLKFVVMSKIYKYFVNNIIKWIEFFYLTTSNLLFSTNIQVNNITCEAIVRHFKLYFFIQENTD